MKLFNTAKLAFNGASSAGLLPWFGWALLLVAALSAGTTGWAVHRWDQGAQAMVDNKELKAQRAADAQAYAQLLATARDLQQDAVDRALAQQQASERMDAIATLLENNLETNRAFAAQQNDALADLLARRPDLRALHLGDDVLQHWNRGNAGPAAGGSAKPAAKPAGKPAPGVPAAPGSAQRPAAGSAGQPRPGGGAVSRLQRSDDLVAARKRRMGGYRVGLVLRRGGSTRPRCVGVPCA